MKPRHAAVLALAVWYLIVPRICGQKFQADRASWKVFTPARTGSRASTSLATVEKIGPSSEASAASQSCSRRLMVFSGHWPGP
jgi:hypothetical protein